MGLVNEFLPPRAVSSEPGRRTAQAASHGIAPLKQAQSFGMTQVEMLSRSSPTSFAELWYDIAGDDHFWLKARFDFFLREIRACGLDPTAPMSGLDVGCGHGAVQRQLAAHTAWRADGCDLNQAALSLHSGRAGRVLDCTPGMRHDNFCDSP